MIVMATLLRFLSRLLRSTHGGHTASVSSTQRYDLTGCRLASLREQAAAPHPIARLPDCPIVDSRWSMVDGRCSVCLDYLNSKVATGVVTLNAPCPFGWMPFGSSFPVTLLRKEIEYG